MNLISFWKLIFPLYIIAVFGCEGKKKKSVNENMVRVHIISEPSSINAQCSHSVMASHIGKHLYQPLLDIDFETETLIPVLAKERPLIEEKEDGKLKFIFSIKEEASWDDGTPITSEDVEFTLKMINNPFIDNHSYRPYFDKIERFEKVENNNKKFILHFSESYIQAEWAFTDLFILPVKKNDPNGIYDVYTYDQMYKNKELLKDKNLLLFAEDFNSEKYQREKQFIIGSGAYKLSQWYTGHRIILERKENWWGDKIKEKNIYFEAYPKKIIYEVIKDWPATIVAIKKEMIDVCKSMSPKDFIELTKSDHFNQNFFPFTPESYSYEYMGLNMKNPILKDIKVRKALAYLTNYEDILNAVLYGLGERTVGPIHPNHMYYNHDLEPYKHDIQKAKELLKEAGWEDTDNNGILDKEIDGQRIEFVVDLFYNVPNTRRESIGLIFKEVAKKVGIEVTLVGKEWSIFIDEIKTHQFDMFILGMGTSPVAPDPKQLWHTSSYYNGSNYCGFGNEETDMLIEDIRKTVEPKKLKDLFYEFQNIIHDQVPCIFFFAPKERIIISNRFRNAKAYANRPGFWEGSLNVNGNK